MTVLQRANLSDSNLKDVLSALSQLGAPAEHKILHLVDLTDLKSVAANQLEGELTELPEVVPGQLALLVVEGEGLGGHNPVRSGALVLEPEHVLLDLGVPEARIHSLSCQCQKRSRNPLKVSLT